MGMSNWIPVSERLPSIGVRVLTCDRDGFIEPARRYEPKVNGIHYSGWEDDDGFFLEINEPKSGVYDIIAWMPLPEPYKEGI